MTQNTSEMVSEKAFKKPDAVGRRTRLREFQAMLAERMQAARTGTDTGLNQLGVLIGDRRWLLNLQEAGEIVSVGAITKVPLTQDWFLGLTNIRGNLISVIDFARFQGQPPTVMDKDCRIVAFAPVLSFNSGLLVSRVTGLCKVGEMEAQAGPADPSVPWSTTRYTDRESQTWTELSLSLVVQDTQFLHVGL